MRSVTLRLLFVADRVSILLYSAITLKSSFGMSYEDMNIGCVCRNAHWQKRSWSKSLPFPAYLFVPLYGISQYMTEFSGIGTS